MASAILVSRNEPFWGQDQVYMRKFTTTNSTDPFLKPNPIPNPNSISVPVRQLHDHTGNIHYRQRTERVQPVKPVPANDADKRNGECITFNLGSYSKWELKQLKKRLVSELEQVRNVITRIEYRDFEDKSRNPGSQLPVTQPSSLQDDKSNQRCLDANFAKVKSKKTKKTMDLEFKENKTALDSGTKRSNPFEQGKEMKRLAMDPMTEKMLTSMMMRCTQILNKLMKDKYAWVFNTPVDVVKLGLHDYNQIVNNPMDLGTVKENMKKCIYHSPLEFASDVRLTFKNALLYNPKGSDVNALAERLLSDFEKMFNPAYKKFEDERLRVLGLNVESTAKPNVAPIQSTISNTTMIQTLGVEEKPSIPHLLAPAEIPIETQQPSKLPKPKAKDPNKRQMSDEEKAKLGMSLQNLPADRMDQLIKILKRTGNLAQDGDEIELDIEAVDIECLWELDRFVDNYNRKMKRHSFVQTTVPEVLNSGHKVRK